MSDRALLIVDIQMDFCKGGTLQVQGAEAIIPVLNRYADFFASQGWAVFASRDWHPPETMHFRKYGGPWPEHCLQGSTGAQFHPELKLPEGTLVISKGLDAKEHNYSAFQGFDGSNRSFLEILKEYGIRRIYIGGIATDYCVKWTAFDALSHSLEVYILADAVKGIDERESRQVLRNAQEAGAKLITFQELGE